MPDHHAAAVQLKSTQDRHQRNGDETGGKPHIEQVVTHVERSGVRSQSRHDKTNQDTNQNGASTRRAKLRSSVTYRKDTKGARQVENRPMMMYLFHRSRCHRA